MESAQGDETKEESRKEKKGLIQIPSYQEVFGISGGDGPSSSRPYNPPPPASFSQAFSFIKSSEFYTPPPPVDQAPREASDSASCSSSYTATSASNSYSPASSSAQNRNAILVSHRQKGNPLLKHIRNAKWAFADIVCDYLLGQSSCALYISLRYHLLHPDYLYYRIRELPKVFKLRVILCHIDVEDVVKPLLEVTKTAMFHDCSLLCGWSLEECGRYLETIKVYENKPADIIREQTDTDYLSRLTRALTTVRRVNKTDVVTLGSTFGSLAGIMDASMEDLARCPGIGERKVKRLYDTFHEPFRRVSGRPATTLTIAEAFSRGKREEAKEAPKEEKEEKEEKMEEEEEKAEMEESRSDASKAERESSVSVRSALDAAYAKYADKIGSPNRKGNPAVKKIGNGGGRNKKSQKYAEG